MYLLSLKDKPFGEIIALHRNDRARMVGLGLTYISPIFEKLVKSPKKSERPCVGAPFHSRPLQSRLLATVALLGGLFHWWAILIINQKTYINTKNNLFSICTRYVPTLVNSTRIFYNFFHLRFTVIPSYFYCHSS